MVSKKAEIWAIIILMEENENATIASEMMPSSTVNIGEEYYVYNYKIRLKTFMHTQACNATQTRLTYNSK